MSSPRFYCVLYREQRCPTGSTTLAPASLHMGAPEVELRQGQSQGDALAGKDFESSTAQLTSPSDDPSKDKGAARGAGGDLETPTGGNAEKLAEEDKKPHASVPYRQLYSQADRLDVFLIICAILASCANGAAWPVFAILFADFTNTFGGMSDTSDFLSNATNVALKFIYLAIGSLVASYFQAALWMWSGNRQTSRLRRLYLKAVLRQDIAFFDVQGTAGGMLQGLNDDSTNVQAAISEKAGHFLQHMTTVVTGIIISFLRGWDMALVMLGCMPFLAFIGFMFSKLSTTISKKSTEAYIKANSIAQQSISQIRTVASYSREQRSADEYNDSLALPLKVGVQQAIVSGICLGGMNAIVYFTYAVAFIYGAWRISVGAYDGGDVLNILVASSFSGFSLGQAGPVLKTFSEGQAAGGNIFAVINRKPDIDPKDPSGKKLEVVVGQLELRNVVFRYPARPDVNIFSDFCLTIPAGKTVALVGSSGSGKSTVVQLIERFYDPLEGSVLLDEVDLRKLNVNWLREQIGIVAQEPTLFAMDIFDNIRLGKEDATWEEVEEAARLANAYNFIASLPKGFQTQVGERGLHLSGGQKQRIAIARAILKNPRIMLLDEATSALDMESERIVQDALSRLIVGRTTVVVAHRLTTVQNADVITVLRSGVIVESGSHQELIATPGGAYATLVQSQMQEESQREQEVAEDDQAFAKNVAMEEILEESVGDSTLMLGQHFAEYPARKLSVLAMKRTSFDMRSSFEKRTSFDMRSSFEKRKSFDMRTSFDRRKSVEKRHPGRASGDVPRVLSHEVCLELTGAGPPHDDAEDSDDSKDKKTGKKKVKKERVDVPMSRLLHINKPEWKYGVLGSVTSVAVGGVQAAFTLVASGIVIVLYEPAAEVMDKASFWCWMFFTLGTGLFIATIVQQWSLGVMGQHLARRIRVMLFTNILREEIGWFDMEENGSGVLTSRLATDASYVRGMVGDTIAVMIQNFFCLAFGYAIALVYDWRMALVVTAALPFLIVGMYFYYQFNMGYESGNSELYAQANQVVSEAFSSVRIVQAYNLQEHVCGVYQKFVHDADITMRKRANITGMLMGYSNGSVFAAYGLVIWFGGVEVSSGRATFENMLTAFVAILTACLGVAQAQIAFPDISKGKAAVMAVFPLIDRQSKIDPLDPSGTTQDDLQGAIELQDVKFVYPARPTVVVFKKFSLVIPAGKTVALVGESGSGKSTIVGLIERFYDPVEGRVLLDGVDLRQYNLQWLRRRVGLVSQEPLLFSCSILDNIRYGRPEATMEEVEEAARSANAYDFITALPDGFNTYVGERGMQLSGGQKQRVAIARAMVKQPKVLLLDEATSALDSQSEQVVQAALDRIMAGCTSVVIAHRLSTVRNADSIALVVRGAILEQGSHDALMALPNGGYAKLVMAQGGPLKSAGSIPCGSKGHDHPSKIAVHLPLT